MSTNSRRHDFDDLNSWAAQLEAKSALTISGQMVDTMKRIASLLEDGPTNEVTRDNFIEFVHDMRAKLRAGSRALGDAIIMAAKHLEKGDSFAAHEVYRAFVASCRSPFYRDIALIQVQNIEDSRWDPD